MKKVPDADHVVISLTRTSNPFKTHFIDCGTTNNIRLIAFRYFAPPMAVFLASDKASLVSGQVIAVDGHTENPEPRS